jgi:hypothetical protein
MMKRSGPSTEPWGAPNLTGKLYWSQYYNRIFISIRHIISRHNYYEDGCLLPLMRGHRSEDGGSKDLWNIGKLLPDYMALQPTAMRTSNPTTIIILRSGLTSFGNLFGKWWSNLWPSKWIIKHVIWASNSREYQAQTKPLPYPIL